jgi:hypothetical protein
VSAIGAGVGALAGYKDPKNGGAVVQKTSHLMDRVITSLDSNSDSSYKKAAFGLEWPPGVKEAWEESIAKSKEPAPLTPAELATENAKTLAAKTADSLLQINQLMQGLPRGEIRAMTPMGSFSSFNPVGVRLKGLANIGNNIANGFVGLEKEKWAIKNDAVAYATGGQRSVITRKFEPSSEILKSFQNGTVLQDTANLAGSTVLNTLKAPFDFMDGMRYGNSEKIGNGGEVLIGLVGGAAGLSRARVTGGWEPNLKAGGTFSKEAPYVIRYDASYPGRPDPKFSLDSLSFNEPIGYNSRGFPRDAGEFWRGWSNLYPDSLSKSNRYLIENYNDLKVSPRVDDVWIKAFPEHGNYMGDVLMHHHVDFGQYTIPVPGKTHVGSGGPWHQ